MESRLPGPSFTVYPLLTAIRPPAEEWAAGLEALERYRFVQQVCAIVGVLALAVHLVALNRFATRSEAAGGWV